MKYRPKPMIGFLDFFVLSLHGDCFLTSQATPGPLPPATTTDHGSSWGPGGPAASPVPPNMTYENIAIEHDPFIVDFPIKNGDFP